MTRAREQEQESKRAREQESKSKSKRATRVQRAMVGYHMDAGVAAAAS
jgi:hypothetical protein